MPESPAFDEFYRDARDRLLLQTYALTGDLPASRQAVREAFAWAWHHWRKVSRAADPETEVRPIAWAQAQRRSTARVWHRDKSLDPDNRATLEALGNLTNQQRKMLLLTALASGTLADHAREVGLTEDAGGNALQHATAQVANARSTTASSVMAGIEALSSELGEDRWPRGSIIRRSGARRRRMHTIVGAAGAVAALLVSGFVVSEGANVRPALAAAERARVEADAQESAAARPETLSPQDLITGQDVRTLARSRTWREGRTTGNDEGHGKVLPCRQSRYADPSPISAMVRSFQATPKKRQPRLSVRQATELSTDVKAARAALRTSVGWYAACDTPRTQLLGTYNLLGVGDDARVFTLRVRRAPAATLVVGLARSGRINTTVASTTTAGRPDVRALVDLLAAATNRACKAESGAGACGAGPVLKARPPYPVGDVPALLSEIDLPGVGTVAKSWVGTVPRKATTNLAASGCARASFNFDTMSRQLTRSFLIPQAKLPATFGITQTAGAMAAPAAKKWIADARSRLATCVAKRLGTGSELLTARGGKQGELVAWRITTEISDARSVSYLMALARHGTAVTQLGFIPAPGATMTPQDFIALAARAQSRLAAMPAPKKVKTVAPNGGTTRPKKGAKKKSSTQG